MTLRIKSALLRRTDSIRRTTLSGITDKLRSNRLPFDNDSTYGSNEYIHNSFLNDDNYLAIIKCLDDGYKVSEDILQWLKDYLTLQQNYADSLSSHTTKWNGKLKQQPTISSYHTTKRAQYQTIKSSHKLAELVQTRCDEIEHVIATFHRQVDRMYPKERLGTVHKHYRSEQVRKAFKTARSALSKLAETLEKLHEQEKQAKESLLAADIQCENYSLDSTVSKSKSTRAKDTQEKRQNELEIIQDKIARAEKEYVHEQETYQQKAMEIYQECREYEKERLDQIQEVLISFAQAAHTSDYSAGQDVIFDDLIEHIKTKQNSIEDLNFWAETYHVNLRKKSTASEKNEDENDTITNESQTTTTRKTKKSGKSENENAITASDKTLPSVAVDEEDQSTANNTSTSTKNKQSKIKKSISIEKKNNSTNDSAAS
ncbi:hypothetical protein I4U23_002279 [Adineta vaga]|nr:hypothetical protein I4U23_002279 [Adineta vaga]